MRQLQIFLLIFKFIGYLLIVLSQNNTNEVSNAVIIDLKKSRKYCPSGFEETDGVCVKTVYATPDIVCTTGTYDEDSGSCITSVAKELTCMSGFIRTGAYCIQNRITLKVLQCPSNTLLRASDNVCVKQVQNPPVESCPNGSTLSNGDCIIVTEQPPTYTCPDGFTLSETICSRIESVPCVGLPPPSTPCPTLRPPLGDPSLPPTSSPSSTTTQPTTRGPTIPGSKEANAAVALQNLRFARLSPDLDANTSLGKASDPAQSLSLSSAASSTQLQAFNVYRSAPLFRKLQGLGRCTRTRTVNAALICEDGDLTADNLCRVTTTVDSVLIPGGLTENLNPPSSVCPTNFVVNPSNTTECVAQDIMTPNNACPEESTPSGDSCIVTSAPTITCPTNFTFLNSNCVQILTTNPKVEYTIKYQCKGKDCQI